jgi:hypothetical protein
MKVKPYIILNTSRKHVNYEEDKNKVPMTGAALAPKMLTPEKSPGIKFCRQFRKVGARKLRCHNLIDFLVIFASIHRNKLGNATRMD